MKNKWLCDTVNSPVGPLRFVVSERGALKALSWDHSHVDAIAARLGGAVGAHNPAGVSAALEAYFAGTLEAIDALDTDGDGTPFQRAVWRELRAIAAGRTETYGQLAMRLKNPKAFRAVGMANRCNPIAIVVPCHRVIGKDGTLTGYAGGLARKQLLLAHEQKFKR
jgi:methylated-DNA-[protein]-cysteine S-methyltransferase